MINIEIQAMYNRWANKATNYNESKNSGDSLCI